MRRLTGLAAFGLAAALGRSAQAQSSAAATAMDDWFAGEKYEAFVFLGLGAASTGTGAYLLTRDTGFARGAGYTAIAFGAVEMIFATTYTLGLGPKHDELKGDLAKDQVKFRRDELDRMNAIADRFVLYRYTELGILAAGAGLATYGFVHEKPALAGIGVTAGVHAVLVLTLDYFAESRAHRYIRALEGYRPETTLQAPGALRRGWGFRAPIMTGAF
ncbi:MAG: hypothetical protein HYZ29_07830 [Myxococcales bacterium]|nr:hypothetical protein [Myxococcales bacterium]